MKNKICLLFVILTLNANSQDEIEKVKSLSFYNATSIGIMPINEKSGPSRMFTIVNGIQFKNRVSIGLGFGIENTDYGYRKDIPLFIEGRYSFTEKPNSIYFSMMTGYLLSANSQYRNDNYGITAGAALGINVFAGKHVGISTSLGYRFSHVVNTNNNYYGCYEIYPYYSYKKHTDLNRFELKVGFIIR